MVALEFCYIVGLLWADVGSYRLHMLLLWKRAPEVPNHASLGVKNSFVGTEQCHIWREEWAGVWRWI